MNIFYGEKFSIIAICLGKLWALVVLPRLLWVGLDGRTMNESVHWQEEEEVVECWQQEMGLCF